MAMENNCRRNRGWYCRICNGKGWHKVINIFPLIIVFVLLLTLISCSISTPNINTLSDKELYVELLKIDGIGKEKANAVIEYRNKNKPIRIEDIDFYVDGFGEVLTSRIEQKFKD